MNSFYGLFMKVLHVNPYPPEHLGGSEIFCKNLAINLNKQSYAKNDILTSDIFKHKKKIDYLDSSIKVIYKKCLYNLWGKNPVVDVSSYLKRHSSEYDLIHAHSYIFFTSFQCALMKKYRKVPMVLHVHGGVQTPSLLSSNPMEYFQLMWKKYIFDKTIGRFTVQNSDALISVSKKDLDLLSRKYNLEGIKLFHIPNAVDISKFQSEGKSRREFITFIGRLSYIKGLDIFLEIVKALHELNPHLKFL